MKNIRLRWAAIGWTWQSSSRAWLRDCTDSRFRVLGLGVGIEGSVRVEGVGVPDQRHCCTGLL